jgi:hypothetical protein
MSEEGSKPEYPKPKKVIIIYEDNTYAVFGQEDLMKMSPGSAVVSGMLLVGLAWLGYQKKRRPIADLKDVLVISLKAE